MKTLMPNVKLQSLSIKVGGNPDALQQIQNQFNMWVRFREIISFVQDPASSSLTNVGSDQAVQGKSGSSLSAEQVNLRNNLLFQYIK